MSIYTTTALPLPPAKVSTPGSLAEMQAKRWQPLPPDDRKGAPTCRVMLGQFVVCLICGTWWATAREDLAAATERAAKCCGPYLCTGCGSAALQYHSYCPPCEGKRSAKHYAAYPLAPEDYDGPVMVGDSLHYSADDFLEDCYNEGIENPYSLEPVICEPVMYPGIDLAERMSELIEVEDDGAIDLAWLAPVQLALDEAIAKANATGTHYWQSINVRPRLDLAEHAKRLAELADEEADQAASLSDAEEARG